MHVRLLLAAAFVSAATLAHAAALPVGSYTLTGVPGTGIHLSDPGSLTGTLFFNAGSTLTAANLTFHDTLTGETDILNSPGPTGTLGGSQPLLFATITDSASPNISYAFSIIIPGNANGTFTLNCGTDCDTDVNNSITHFNEEFTGSIAPAATPEPASFVLLGTGLAGMFSAARRRSSSSRPSCRPR